jgi:hypothetical protein
MREVYAPLNVQITDVSPGSAPHFEIMVGGRPEQIGLATGIGGVSPFSCQPYIPNSVVFVCDVWGNDPEELCATAAQEVAHSFTLDHCTEPSDPMTYFPFKGRRHDVNAQIQCGSDCDANHRSPLGAPCGGASFQEHAYACGSGAQTQNDVQVISALFGGGQTPPEVQIVAPRIGDTVEPGFSLQAEISDNVAVSSAELRVDGPVGRQHGRSAVGIHRPGDDGRRHAHAGGHRLRQPRRARPRADPGHRRPRLQVARRLPGSEQRLHRRALRHRPRRAGQPRPGLHRRDRLRVVAVRQRRRQSVLRRGVQARPVPERVRLPRRRPGQRRVLAGLPGGRGLRRRRPRLADRGARARPGVRSGSPASDHRTAAVRGSEIARPWRMAWSRGQGAGRAPVNAAGTGRWRWPASICSVHTPLVRRVLIRNATGEIFGG